MVACRLPQKEKKDDNQAHFQDRRRPVFGSTEVQGAEEEAQGWKPGTAGTARCGRQHVGDPGPPASPEGGRQSCGCREGVPQAHLFLLRVLSKSLAHHFGSQEFVGFVVTNGKDHEKGRPWGGLF